MTKTRTDVLALGNAIVPQVALEIFRAIQAAEMTAAQPAKGEEE